MYNATEYHPDQSRLCFVILRLLGALVKGSQYSTVDGDVYWWHCDRCGESGEL